MTHNYVLNIAGCKLSEKQMENIPCPRLELTTHVSTKVIQAGAVLGTALVGPIVSVAGGNRDFQSIQQSAYQYGKKGAMLGMILGPALVMSRLATMQRQGAWDRAYRLRFNRNQAFVDRISVLGVIAGMGTAHYLGDELCKGAVFGLVGGCMLGGVLNSVF